MERADEIQAIEERLEWYSKNPYVAGVMMTTVDELKARLEQLKAEEDADVAAIVTEMNKLRNR